MNIEVYEIGSVQRCGCLAETVFSDIREADAFRRTALKSIITFLLITFSVACAEVTMHATGL